MTTSKSVSKMPRSTYAYLSTNIARTADNSVRRILAMSWFRSIPSETVSTITQNWEPRGADHVPVGIYTDKVLDSYRGKNRLEMPPHVFAVAESSYYNMNAYKENQCVIISGESGAGKTEAAKRIMQYIASVSGGSDSSIQQIKDMVLATNPLLESFGNAKTLRNNNSSRFGKYLELQFNAQGEPVGANITNYLLEKSRVVGQITNERNFHIFYQFAKAASSNHRGNTILVLHRTTTLITLQQYLAFSNRSPTLIRVARAASMSPVSMMPWISRTP